MLATGTQELRCRLLESVEGMFSRCRTAVLRCSAAIGSGPLIGDLNFRVLTPEAPHGEIDDDEVEVAGLVANITGFNVLHFLAQDSDLMLYSLRKVRRLVFGGGWSTME